MDGKVVTVVILHITDEELGEAVKEEVMDFGIVTMSLAELRGLSEESVGHRFTIDLVDDGRTIEVGLVVEQLTYIRRELTLEDVAHQSFSDIGCTTLIAQDVT